MNHLKASGPVDSPSDTASVGNIDKNIAGDDPDRAIDPEGLWQGHK